MLSIDNLSVRVADKLVLHNVSATFRENAIYAIMGPNGSGKSTLAYALMGYPDYEVVTGSIRMSGENITGLEPDERSHKGIFLSFQTPLTLSGVTIYQLMHMALKGRKDALSIRKQVQTYARELEVPEHLLARSLNEGASGGERKKLEVLQAMMLDRNVMIFDEIDTGVDVDALRVICAFINTHRTHKTFIIITHYNKILHYMNPDHVIIMKNGHIAKIGDKNLAERIEHEGYAQL